MRRLVSVLLFVLAFPLLGAERTFKASDGTTLHYTISGKGETIVFLSGGPGFSGDYLQPIADRFASRYTTVVPDQRGTGKSKLATYDATTLTTALEVADLEMLRKELKLEKLTLAGHSWGGILSMLYASAHPDRVRALILISSGGPTLTFVDPSNKNLAARTTEEDKAKVLEWTFKAAEQPKKAMLEITRARTPSYFADRAKAKHLMDSLTEDSFELRVFQPLMNDLTKIGYDLREPLKKLKAPVLILHGRQDPIVTVDDTKAAIPSAKVVWLENAGHFPWEEQPEAFFKAMDGFLGAL
jgi:proline iminopeptidase